MNRQTTLRVERLHLSMFIGVLPSEHEAKQTVIVSIDMQVAIPDRPSEAAQDYVSYAPIVEHLLARAASGRHIDLVEELADDIFAFAFEDRRITSARVEIMKPDIFAEADGVGIVITRDNPHSDGPNDP